MIEINVCFVVNGALVEGKDVEVSGPGFTVTTPDPVVLVGQASCRALDLADLHEVSLDEIIDVLVTLGERLSLETNPYVQEAFELSIITSDLPERVLRTIYDEQLSLFFRRDLLHDAVDRRLGRDVLERWVAEQGPDGRDLRVRAYGARIAHVVAGNTPGVSAVTVARNALTRGHAIIKTPSNDPLTAVAIARTLAEVAPDHPLSRHLSVLHWRGGDASVESRLFSPAMIDKLVAWGGTPAIEGVSEYAGPGLELITLDPKRSSSLLGSECLTPGSEQDDAARRLARDVGLFNQAGCVNARVVYVRSDGGSDVDSRLSAFARIVYDEIQRLPEAYSAPSPELSPKLRDAIEMASLLDDPELVGGGSTDGGVIVSTDGRSVDWAEHLGSRYVNLVLVDDLEPVIADITSVVQTIGVWPNALREQLRHRLALAGGQRIVDLGGATNRYGNQGIPQDGIEVLRRMCRWIVDEADPREDDATSPTPTVRSDS